jgi:hypothetical protein
MIYLLFILWRVFLCLLHLFGIIIYVPLYAIFLFEVPKDFSMFHYPRSHYSDPRVYYANPWDTLLGRPTAVMKVYEISRFAKDSIAVFKVKSKKYIDDWEYIPNTIRQVYERWETLGTVHKSYTTRG